MHHRRPAVASRQGIIDEWFAQLELAAVAISAFAAKQLGADDAGRAAPTGLFSWRGPVGVTVNRTGCVAPGSGGATRRAAYNL